MTSCGWLYAKELICYHSLLALWRLLHDTQRKYFDNRIRRIEDNFVEMDEPRLKTTSDSFHWRASCWWNLLPQFLRDTNSMSNFKRTLKRFIIEERVLGRPQ